MRVAQVSFYADPLGRGPDALLEAWPTLPAVARATSRAGIETTVVQAAAVDAERTLDGVRFVFVAEPAPGRLRRRMGLWAAPGGERTARRAVDLGADALHVHGLGFPAHVRRLARLSNGTPILVQDHADRPPPRWAAPIWRRACERVTGVAFTACEQALPFIARGALPGNIPVHEVLESSSDFRPGEAGHTGPPGAPDTLPERGDPTCFWMGRLDANKDPLTALDAFEIFAAAVPEARLSMCWRDGWLESAVRRRIASSHVLAPRVRLLGALPHPHVEQALRHADFLMQASRSEGSGYAVIEALACGVTPVVTNIPAFRRITRDGAVGALFDPGDPQSMASALLRLSAIVRARDNDDRHPGSVTNPPVRYAERSCAGETTSTHRQPLAPVPLGRHAMRMAARAHFDAHLSFDVVARELCSAYSLITGAAAVEE